MDDFMSVDRVTNPKSKNYGMWYVGAYKDRLSPCECVFMDKSKKKCVEYAKSHAVNVHVTNGIEYGCRF